MAKWTKAQHIKFENTMHKKNQTAKRERAARVEVDVADKQVATNQLNQVQTLTPRVDENYIRERAFRSGLLAALECILRELR